MGREESRWYKPRKKTSEEDAEIVKSGEEVSDKKDWQHYRERGGDYNDGDHVFSFECRAS